MPRSKREKEVSLTKVKKKTREGKNKLTEEVRSCVERFAFLYVFSVDNMRSDLFLKARQHFKATSRFFFGKNNVMAVALGRTKADEASKNLHKIASTLHGQCGLMFTNSPRAEVVQFFDDFKHLDYARGGEAPAIFGPTLPGLLATQTVDLPEGVLPQFSFSLEPQLRKLGMPTKLEKGQVALYQPFHVCTEGEPVNTEQAKILKLLDIKMSEFKIHLTKCWERSTGKITNLSDDA